MADPPIARPSPAQAMTARQASKRISFLFPQHFDSILLSPESGARLLFGDIGEKEKCMPGKCSRRGAVLLMALLPHAASAATSVWNGLSGVDNNWNTGGNWNGGNTPSANADLIFPTGAPTSSNNNFSSIQLNSLALAASNYALSGNAVTLGSATPGSGNITVSTGAANNAASFNIALAGGAGNNQFITVNSGAALTLSGQLSGTTGSKLVKSGAGTLILTNDNSGFTGPFSIDSNGGVVRILHASALGDPVQLFTVGANSQLQIDSVAGTIAKPLVLNGAGPSSNGALLNVAGTNTLSGTVLLDSDATLGATAGAMILNGLISDSGVGHNLTITGAGRVTLAHASGNTYRGTTTVNSGVLNVANTSGSATGLGAVVINNGGTLRGNGALSGSVNLNSGGVIDPLSVSGGGLSIGPMTWNGGGTIATDLAASAADSDRIDSTGALLKGSAGLYQFNFDTPGALAGNTYVLMQFTSTTFAPGDFSFISSNPNLAGSFSFDSMASPTQLRFTVTLVPEPALASALVLLPLAAWRRHRRGR
jgi:autotransporter-associated beta strand protein